MLKVCLVVDVEGFVSLKQTNPMWNFSQRIKAKLNYLIKNLRYNKKGFSNIYNLSKRYKFPMTFMLVGSLFKPLGNEKFIDYGYHTLSHKPLTLISDPELEKEVRNIYKVVSFSPPIGLCHDIKNPERIFKILTKEKYKIIPYRGTMNGVKVASKKVGGIEKPINLFGIKGIYVSAYLSDNGRNYKEILADIIKNKKKNAIYLITTHDFVFKKMNNFEQFMKELKILEKQKAIKTITLKQLI